MIAASSTSPLLEVAGAMPFDVEAAFRPGFLPGLRPRLAFGIPLAFRQRLLTLLIRGSLALSPALLSAALISDVFSVPLSRIPRIASLAAPRAGFVFAIMFLRCMVVAPNRWEQSYIGV